MGTRRNSRVVLSPFIILKPLGCIIRTKPWPFPGHFQILLYHYTNSQYKTAKKICKQIFISLLSHSTSETFPQFCGWELTFFFLVVLTFPNTETGISQETKYVQIHSMNLPWIFSELCMLKLIHSSITSQIKSQVYL